MRSASIFIGANRTPGGSALRYAESDAVSTQRLFTGSLGPGTDDDSRVLLGRNATRDSVRDALAELRWGAPDCIVVFFSGHGSSRGIGLSDGTLKYDDLASQLSSACSERPVVVVDACHAGAAIRPFLTRIGGVGGLDSDVAAEWAAALAAAAPGIRLYAAVADGHTTREDPAIGAGRFSWCFRRALRFGPGRRFTNHAWVTDVDAFTYAARELRRRWPSEPAPILLAPRQPERHLPLVLAQSVHAVGQARIASISSTTGECLTVDVATRGRQYIATHIDGRVFDRTGNLLAVSKRQIIPARTHDSTQEVFRPSRHALRASNDVACAMLFHQPFPLHWEFRLTDDFGRLLDSYAGQHVHRGLNGFGMTGDRAAGGPATPALW